ncbi:DUF2179 domain-containing protein [bacterium]|nr:DUF2179 domain-containing protein [bacterium]
MDIASFFHSHTFSYLVLPLFIFCARIMDVSIGTMRVIFVSKGFKAFAAMCGFFEVLIWIFAITTIMRNLTNVFNYFAYAAGFATGNYVGMVIEEKIALGTVLVRVVARNSVLDLIEYLKNNNYGVTIHDAQGLYGNVTILFTIIPRQNLASVVSFIKQINPQAFYTVEDVRFVNQRIFPNRAISSFDKRQRFSLRYPFRKGK